MKELEEWYSQISSLEQLSFKEAKDLYKKAMNTTDEVQKKAYLDKIVLGTLYVVYNYIRNSNLKLFVTSSYDMNDIISSFNNVWTKAIYNGELMNVSSFSLMFSNKFLSEVCDNISGINMSIGLELGVTIYELMEVINIYVLYKNQSIKSSFERLLKEKYFETGKWSKSKYISILNIVPFIDNLYNNLNFNKEDDLELGVTKIHNYIRILVLNGMLKPLSNDQPVEENMEDEIIRKIINENVRNDIDKAITDEQDRYIIKERFKFDGSESTGFKELGDKYNFTRERARQIEKETLLKLKNSKYYRIYKNDI